MLVVNYLHRPLFPVLARALRRGGWLIYETYTNGPGASGASPRTPSLPPRARRAARPRRSAGSPAAARGRVRGADGLRGRRPQARQVAPPDGRSRRRALHPPVARAAAAFARGPARAEHVRRLAVHAVRRVHHQACRPAARRPRPGTCAGRARRPRAASSPSPTMRCEGMSSRVALPALNTASSLREGELAVGREGLGGNGPPRHLGVGLGRDAAAGEGPPGHAS